MNYLLIFVIAYIIYLGLDYITPFKFINLPVASLAIYILFFEWYLLTFPLRIALGVLISFTILDFGAQVKRWHFTEKMNQEITKQLMEQFKQKEED